MPISSDEIGKCAKKVAGGRWKVAGHQLCGAEASQVQRHRRHEADGLVCGEVTRAKRPRFTDVSSMGQGQHVHRGWHGSADSHPLGVIPALRGQRDGEVVLTCPALEGGKVPERDGQRTVIPLVDGAGSHDLQPGA